jgi:hypothetical protein
MVNVGRYQVRVHVIAMKDLLVQTAVKDHVIKTVTIMDNVLMEIATVM